MSRPSAQSCCLRDCGKSSRRPPEQTQPFRHHLSIVAPPHVEIVDPSGVPSSRTPSASRIRRHVRGRMNGPMSAEAIGSALYQPVDRRRRRAAGPHRRRSPPDRRLPPPAWARSRLRADGDNAHTPRKGCRGRSRCGPGVPRAQEAVHALGSARRSPAAQRRDPAPAPPAPARRSDVSFVELARQADEPSTVSSAQPRRRRA